MPTDANPDAEDAVKLIKDDMPVGASVGFRILDYDGDRQDGYKFHQSDLLETSLVGIPSNPETVNAGPETGAVSAKGAPTAMNPAFMQLMQAPAPASAPGQEHSFQTDTARDAPTNTMDNGNDTPDDDTNELLEWLISLQERTVEEMDEQRDRLAEERSTDPDAEGEKDAGEAEGEEPEDVDRRELSVVLDENADEKAVEEFERLKQHASEEETDQQT